MSMKSMEQTSTKPTMQNKNVAGGQLALFSKDPPTGYYKDGYCRTTPEDSGNHSVAAVVNKEFLDFSASKGNNLTDVGVKPGMKWCLCANRWKQAFDAASNGQLSKEAVPKVYLHASHEKALDTVSYKDLKQYAVTQEAAEGRGRSRQDTHHNPESQGGIAKESKDIGGEHGTTAPSKESRK